MNHPHRCDTDALLDHFRAACRALGYSRRTRQAYAQWILRYVRYHGRRRPRDMGAPEVAAFVDHLARERCLAPSTCNQALDALRLLYDGVLGRPLGPSGRLPRFRLPPTPPAVASPAEIRRLFWALRDPYRLAAGLLYGSGLRLMECVRLRVSDADFRRHRLFVRGRDGVAARCTLLPVSLEPMLRAQIGRAVRRCFEDARAGDPAAPSSPAEAYVFPGLRRSFDVETGTLLRRHVSPSAVQKAVRAAAREAGVDRPALCRTLRHSFAAHLVEHGWPLARVQALMGHRDVRTTHVYARLYTLGAPDAPGPGVTRKNGCSGRE